MKHAAILISGIGLLVSATPIGALVLCAAPNGALVAANSCRPGTTQLDPATLGLVGPPGGRKGLPARKVLPAPPASRDRPGRCSSS